VTVFATGDEAARTIDDLIYAGATIAAVVDLRPQSSEVMRHAAECAGASLHQGSCVIRAEGTKRGVTAASILGPSGRSTIACDLIAMSGGWNPTIHLASHTGCQPVWSPPVSAFVPGELPVGMHAAGAASGRWSLDLCLADGIAAGSAAAEAAGYAARPMPAPRAEPEPSSHAPQWRVRGARGKCFIDFQNDVTDRDLALAEREGFRRAEHMKRYTTLGMATDQGKTANVTALALMAELTGRPIESAGTTTFRPPFTPVAIGAFAGHARGRHFRPTRLAPTHAWSHAAGAVFVEAGAWLRAQDYPRAGERGWLESASREAANVRSAVGFCDVSTLGKIDVQGRDAGTFLDRLYANTISSLPVGRVRYGLMLREDSIVLDDGTVARLGEERWFVTTTTANAARVLQHMEYCHAMLWPELDVQFCSVTDQWAQVALAGPRSRDVLERIVAGGADVSDQALPYLAVRAARLGPGVPARIFRVSFSGERGYEISVPARYGNWLAAALAEHGAPFGIIPYGTEALSILRIEKGHPAGGELNGQTTAADLGLARLLSTRKDFIGRTLSFRPAFLDPARPVLCGFAPIDRSAVLSAGAHFFEPGAPMTVGNDLGHMTSAAYSPTLGHWIGLGLLSNGTARLGTVVRACDPVRGRDTPVRVSPACFIDPEGTRLRG